MAATEFLIVDCLAVGHKPDVSKSIQADHVLVAPKVAKFRGCVQASAQRHLYPSMRRALDCWDCSAHDWLRAWTVRCTVGCKISEALLQVSSIATSTPKHEICAGLPGERDGRLEVHSRNRVPCAADPKLAREEFRRSGSAFISDCSHFFPLFFPPSFATSTAKPPFTNASLAA